MSDPAVRREPGPLLDAAWLRRARARHACEALASTRVVREVASRLMQHLDPIRIEPRVVLDLGAAHGLLTSLLRERYPRSAVLALDDCLAVLRREATGRPLLRRFLERSRRRVCGDASRLPLASASIDLVCSNLALGRWAKPQATLRECRRVLRHGGLLMMSFPGPDTLCELRQAWAAVDRRAHLVDFPDLHQLGDALVAAGFSDVVVDVERIAVEFEDVPHLLRELRAAGGGNAHPTRHRGLLTPRHLQRLQAAYPRASQRGPCIATLELGHAHAWVLERPGTPVALPLRRG